MRGKAEVSPHHLRVDLPLIHHAKQPRKPLVDSWPGQFRQKGPRFQGAERHERLTESALNLQKQIKQPEPPCYSRRKIMRIVEVVGIYPATSLQNLLHQAARGQEVAPGRVHHPRAYCL